MAKILVTGGTGVMGRRLLAQLMAKGHEVRVMALPGDPNLGATRKMGAEVVEADVADAASLVGVCQDVHTVYHLAAVILAPGREEIFTRVNVNGTRHILAEAKKNGVTHFVHISSASVVYPHPNAYSLSKRLAESLVKESGLNWTIVRPTLAYEDNGAAEFMHYVAFLKRFPVVPLIGGGRALKSPVHVEDIIQGLVGLFGQRNVFGKVYNFSGGSALSLRKMSELLLEWMGCPVRFITLPIGLCRAGARLVRLLSPWLFREPLLTWQTISGVTQDANLDNTWARQDFGYSPRPFEEGIRTLHSLKKAGGSLI